MFCLTPHNIRHRQVGQPMVDPISVDQVKEHLRIEHSDDDAYLTSLIDAAVNFVDVDGVLGKPIIDRKFALEFRDYPTTPVRLPYANFKELDNIKVIQDGTLVTQDNDDFQIGSDGDFRTVEPVKGKEWPVADDVPYAYQIVYKAGLSGNAAGVPATIKHALLLLVAHWYENRTATEATSYMPLPFGFNELIGINKNSWVHYG